MSAPDTQNFSEFPPTDAVDAPKNGIWFSEWLRQRRFSHVQIAERLGVTTATISNYTRSTEPLRTVFLLALDAIDAADIEERRRSKIMGGGA